MQPCLPSNDWNSYTIIISLEIIGLSLVFLSLWMLLTHFQPQQKFTILFNQIDRCTYVYVYHYRYNVCSVCVYVCMYMSIIICMQCMYIIYVCMYDYKTQTQIQRQRNADRETEEVSVYPLGGGGLLVSCSSETWLLRRRAAPPQPQPQIQTQTRPRQTQTQTQTPLASFPCLSTTAFSPLIRVGLSQPIPGMTWKSVSVLLSFCQPLLGERKKEPIHKKDVFWAFIYRFVKSLSRSWSSVCIQLCKQHNSLPTYK